MHFEVLVEDKSGKAALEILLPKILDESDTKRIIAYKGIGHIPKNLNAKNNPANHCLLNKLPRMLRAYGKTHSGNPPAAVIVVCDLDDKCLKEFRRELLAVLDACDPKPVCRFCIVIEEGEAWFLGDLDAILKAYPRANDALLKTYVNDSICGTWEKLADAVYPGGAEALERRGWQITGAEKSKWAKEISSHMDIQNSKSPSFRYFRDKIRELCGDEINA